tara:strand:+ start:338 stop:727 length:390 start_codon:yes stop_codon:yes gene_type:complete
MSIDDESPDAWTRINKKYKYQVHWGEEEEDNAPNDHPLYGDKLVHDVYSLEPAPDMVDNPPHYNNGSIECIEAIEAMLNKDEYIGYLRGNALKYRWRFRYKNKPFEDLRKARWYEDRLMKFLLDNQDAV